MIRKITMLLLLFVGVHGFANAQTEDSVQIYLPFGSDTTCPGAQLTFTAVETNDTAIGSTFKWFANDAYTGVSIDTFITTALNNGDSVYCKVYFTNSGGFTDSARSNVLTIYRSSTVMPTTMISITAGSNPDCPGNPITFTAYPGNGGPGPQYQWYVDNIAITSATTNVYTDIFNNGDTVTCMMVSNSTCAFPTDTAYSNGIEVLHDSLTAMVSVSVLTNPICMGEADTFTAAVTDAGIGSVVYWFVNGVQVPGAIGPVYPTDTLRNSDIVYCMLIASDACVINDTTISATTTMTVLPNLNPSASIVLTAGANPGCIDSAITFTATYADGGTMPDLLWLVNDTVVASGAPTHTQAYENGDLLTFRVRTVDGGCYVDDSVTTPSVLMVRDSTPVAPLVSLIENLLVANTAGTYIWYFNGTIIPGANAQTYHPGINGYYFAIRDTGNCQSLPSNTIYISLLKVDEIAAAKVNVYPNPTSGIITLDWGANTARAEVTVSNVIGQVVMTSRVYGKNREEIDLTALLPGNYILSVRNENGNVSTHKVLLTR